MGAQAVRLSNVDIDNALKNKDFEVLFQPIFDLGNGALARMETFVRWRHGSLGVLPPGAFISFFEAQGRMGELTRYVLSEALNRYLEWRGPIAPGFSINLALSDLSDEAFCPHFEVLLRERGFPTDLVTLECPMPPVNMPHETACAQFARLAGIGARLAIEVRGRANDFLRTIDPFPFDEIKTGGAAILRFARTVRGPGMSAISELLDIATKNKAAITAVGVEDQASLSALRGLGFAAAQGNHLAKVGDLAGFTPSRVNEVRALLGLEALSTADLHAMFRAEGPSPAAQATALVAAADVVRPAVEIPSAGDDNLVERLAARIARHSESEHSEQPPAPQPQRQTARAAVKAAAIARAKRKAQAAARIAERRMRSEATRESEAARDLQARLTREFDAMVVDDPADVVSPVDEFDLPGEAPVAASGLDSHASGGLRSGLAPSQTANADESDPVLTSQQADAEASAVEESAVTASDEDQAEAETAAAGAGRRSLAVPGARAHFRPGIRIGITPRGPTRPVAAPMPVPSAPKIPERELLKQFDAMKADAAEPVSPAPPPDEITGDLASGDIAFEETPIGDRPLGDHAVDEVRKPGRRRRTFLTRTVMPWPPPMPTHFWPRSWRRAFGRQRGRPEAAESQPQ